MCILCALTFEYGNEKRKIPRKVLFLWRPFWYLERSYKKMPHVPYDPTNEPENDERAQSIDKIIDRILNGGKTLSPQLDGA